MESRWVDYTGLQPDFHADTLCDTELFLPSYANYEGSHDLEHKQDPVEDIIVTEEEADAMLPQ